MKRSPRIGLLLAPLVVPLAFAVWVAIVGDDPAVKDSLWGARPLAWILVLGAIALFSYAVSVLLGVPLIRALRRLDRLAFWSVVPAAALIGAVALVAVVFGSDGYTIGPIWLAVAKIAGMGALLGVLVGASYCWLSGTGSR